MSVLVALLLQSVVSSPPAREAPRLAITPEDYLVGPVTLRASLEPIDLEIQSADFYVDGAIACRIPRRPLVCAYDAGPQPTAHRVRVTVTLVDGRRLSAGFESKAMVVEESVNVRRVLVPVAVWDRRGRFISGLTQDSFEIREDGVAQTVQLFTAETVPLELTLAIDISESMAPIIDRVKAEAKTFLERLRPTDTVNLVAFNQRVFALTPAESTREERERAIDRLRAGGGTSLFDAIVRGVSLLGRHLSRRAVIVFTDGRDEHSLATIDAVEEHLAASDVLLYLVTYSRTPDNDKLGARLDRLVESSGGRSFTIEDINDLRDAFKGIVDDLSQHYLLSYTPQKTEQDGAFRTIAVKLNGRSERDYRIKARAGYRASAPGK